MNGHLEAERLLQSPWIDYFAGPPSYYEPSRKAGGSGLQRAPIRSIQLHGKMWFDEIDNGYLQDKRERDFVRSWPLGDTTYLPVLQRSLWLPLMQGCGLWLYDFGPRRNTGWWDSPLYLNEIRRTLDYFRKNTIKAEPKPAEALVVWDTESFYHVKNVNSKICEQGLDAAAEELQCSGFATDQIYLFDLDRIELQPYKLILFMNAWRLSPGQRRFILDTVAQNGRTLVWNYGAGYTDGLRSGIDLSEQISGFILEKKPRRENPVWLTLDFIIGNPEAIDPLLVVADTQAFMLGRLASTNEIILARKIQKKYKSIYASVPLHNSGVFRSVLETAACIPLNDRTDFTFLSSNRLLLHTGSAGKRTLFLKDGKALELELPKNATRLLDAETGAVILE